MLFLVYSCASLTLTFAAENDATLPSEVTENAAANATTGAASDWNTLLAIQNAAERLTYSGSLIYQIATTTTASHITHYVDHTGIHEKVEMLEGKPVEYVRHNDEVRSYRPEQHLILLENAHANNRFPSLSSTLTPEIFTYYRFERLPAERVAGLLCSVFALAAKDPWRYSYRLWVDQHSGLLLKVETRDENNALIQKVGFTDVKIGKQVSRRKLQSSFHITSDWKVMSHPMHKINLSAEGWQMPQNFSGFKKVHEWRRSVLGQPEVTQTIFSDGMSTLSIFIRPYENEAVGAPGQHAGHQHKRHEKSMVRMSGASTAHRGAIQVFGRQIGAYRVTVLGEVPAATVKALAESITLKPLH